MPKYYLIHGEDQQNSRNFLNVLIKELNPKNEKNVFQTSGKSLTPELILQNIQSNSFFGHERILVIENLITGNRSKTKNDVLTLLSESKNFSNDIDLVIWEGSSLTAASIKPLKNFISREFKLPTILFTFLDSFKPKNAKQNHFLLTELLKTQPIELIFFMLAKRVRQLFEISTGNQIKTSPWQLNKLTKQANYFNQNQLKKLYMDLIIIDYNNKTGNLNTSLTNELDMLLIKL